MVDRWTWKRSASCETAPQARMSVPSVHSVTIASLLWSALRRRSALYRRRPPALENASVQSRGSAHSPGFMSEVPFLISVLIGGHISVQHRRTHRYRTPRSLTGIRVRGHANSRRDLLEDAKIFAVPAMILSSCRVRTSDRDAGEGHAIPNQGAEGSSPSTPASSLPFGLTRVSAGASRCGDGWSVLVAGARMGGPLPDVPEGARRRRD